MIISSTSRCNVSGARLLEHTEWAMILVETVGSIEQGTYGRDNMDRRYRASI